MVAFPAVGSQLEGSAFYVVKWVDPELLFGWYGGATETMDPSDLQKLRSIIIELLLQRRPCLRAHLQR